MLERHRRVMQLTIGAVLLLVLWLVWMDRKTMSSFAMPSARGTLHSGLMAIGGETTGWLIDSTQGEIEVDVSAVEAMAHALDGKTVIAKGQWQNVKGIERVDRRVLVVRELRVDASR